jgi:hypothetical protein
MGSNSKQLGQGRLEYPRCHSRGHILFVKIRKISHLPPLDTFNPILVVIFEFCWWFGLRRMDLNFLEYPQYHFRDRIGRNSRLQPNHRYRFCDRSIGDGFVGFFCSFGRIYLSNLYGKNRYNNLKEKVLRYGEVRDHCQLVSCLLEHHQRLDHEGKCSHWVVFLTISRLHHRVQTISFLPLLVNKTYLEPIVVKLSVGYVVFLIK